MFGEDAADGLTSSTELRPPTTNTAANNEATVDRELEILFELSIATPPGSTSCFHQQRKDDDAQLKGSNVIIEDVPSRLPLERSSLT
jgi:hypothetical protein